MCLSSTKLIRSINDFKVYWSVWHSPPLVLLVGKITQTYVLDLLNNSRNSLIHNFLLWFSIVLDLLCSGWKKIIIIERRLFRWKLRPHHHHHPHHHHLQSYPNLFTIFLPSSLSRCFCLVKSENTTPFVLNLSPQSRHPTRRSRAGPPA